LIKYKYLFKCSGATFYQKIDMELIQRREDEPTTKYKYSTLASGATPIGSAGRAPDKNGKDGKLTIWRHDIKKVSLQPSASTWL
jgi:hypothetical protein